MRKAGVVGAATKTFDSAWWHLHGGADRATVEDGQPRILGVVDVPRRQRLRKLNMTIPLTDPFTVTRIARPMKMESPEHSARLMCRAGKSAGSYMCKNTLITTISCRPT